MSAPIAERLRALAAEVNGAYPPSYSVVQRDLLAIAEECEMAEAFALISAEFSERDEYKSAAASHLVALHKLAKLRDAEHKRIERAIAEASRLSGMVSAHTGAHLCEYCAKQANLVLAILEGRE